MLKKLSLFIILILFCKEIALAQNIVVLTINDCIINPITVEYIQRGLKEAERRNAILLIQLDTPGGLLKPTQKIVKLFLNSSLPIVVYITPSGARATSAGVFISYAANILVMATSTHIGAAHPVIGGGSWGNLSKEIKDKIINDTIAWAEAIAEKRKRPVGFIKEAITKSVSLTEKEARRRNVCDLIAKNLDELLINIDGKNVETTKGSIILSTKHSQIKYLPLTTREKILNTVIDPNIAYLLLTLGFLGLIFEVTHPGFGIPGILSIISLIFAFYALNILPVNYAGLFFIILGVVFFVIEVFTPTFGIFTVGGLLSLTLGTLMLFNQPFLVKVSFKVFIPLIIFLTMLILFLLTKGIKIQWRKSLTGKDGLINQQGKAVADIDNNTGKVWVRGELWEAYSSQPIKKGETVVVEQVEGLKMYVKRKEER